VFEKGEAIRYISHLDLMRVFQRILVRSGLKLIYSLGFNPHILLSLASALPVGICGMREIADIRLENQYEKDAILTALRRESPPGIVIHDVISVRIDCPSPAALLYASEYAVRLDAQMLASINQHIPTLFLLKDAQVSYNVKGIDKHIDIKPLVLSLICNVNNLVMVVVTHQNTVCKPQYVLKKLAELAEINDFQWKGITRTHMFLSSGEGRLQFLECAGSSC